MYLFSRILIPQSILKHDMSFFTPNSIQLSSLLSPHSTQLSSLLSHQEGSGAESDMISLRSALQKVERSGIIDFTFGGHQCERPQEVQQGRADDCFRITPDPPGQLLWRANTINVRNLKATNVASYFPWSKLSSCALELVGNTK